MGPDRPPPRALPCRARGTDPRCRGRRLHRHLVRRDAGARWLHAADAGVELDRADAARDRRRRRLPARPGTARDGGRGARRRQRRSLRARHRLLLQRDRRTLERDPLRAAAVQGLARRSTSCARRSPASAPAAASSSRRRPPPRYRSSSRRCAARCCGWRPRRPTAPSPTSCRSPASTGRRAARRAPAGFELLCRFFCMPGEREQVEPIARFMFASYATVPVYEKFFRWLGHGPSDRRDGRGLAREGSRAGAGGRPLGADRGDLHPRRARRDAASVSTLRGRRHHAADPHPDHNAGQDRRADRGARAGRER